MAHIPIDGKNAATGDPRPVDNDPNEGSTTNGGASADDTEHVEGASKPRRRQGLTFTHFRDLTTPPPKPWLVEELLGAREVSCVYGKPSSSKSLLVGDLALHVAAGLPWFGRQTLHGGVIYVAAERSDVVKRRIFALKQEMGLVDVPLVIVSGLADFTKEHGHVREIAYCAQQLTLECGLPTALIVVDTLNRVLAGKDENSSLDMGRFIRVVANLQEQTGAHILIVHHEPNEGGRMRGHSSWLGACDTTLRVQKSRSGYTASVDKANDGPEGQSVGYELLSVDVGHDPKTGVVITAPVVVAKELQERKDRAIPLKTAERSMLKVLEAGGADGLTKQEWFERARASGFGTTRRANLTNGMKGLVEKGLVDEQYGIWRVSIAKKSD